MFPKHSETFSKYFETFPFPSQPKRPLETKFWSLLTVPFIIDGLEIGIASRVWQFCELSSYDGLEWSDIDILSAILFKYCILTIMVKLDDPINHLISGYCFPCRCIYWNSWVLFSSCWTICCKMASFIEVFELKWKIFPSNEAKLFALRILF